MTDFLKSLAILLNEWLGGTPAFLSEGPIGTIMSGFFLMSAIARHDGRKNASK
jgi:hypothetical protein